MINNISLVGRVGANPEIKYFESGKIKATFRIALNRATKEKQTDWFEIQCWAKQAEIVAEYLKKGHLVGIEGALQVEEWETQEGQKRTKTFVNARNVRLMQPKGEGTGGGGDSRGGTSEPRQDDDLDAIFSSEDEIPF